MQSGTAGNKTRLIVWTAVVLALLPAIVAVGSPLPTESSGPLGDEPRAVDVVIALDTSGSMEQLLDSARARLWDVVGELGRMKPTPMLRVGLLTFGTESGGAEDGFIVQHVDLTDDLDAAYAGLMALTTEGSEEFVGRAIHTAIDSMSWSGDWNALRVIFIAGNESADQGVDDFDFRVAIRAARDRSIVINALFAGNREQAVTEKWPEIARIGEGNFSAIDPTVGTLQIPTPHDEILLELNARLNQTYVPYGPNGSDGLANQVAQDGNASRLGVQSCSSRIVAKGTSLYTNASWDLVDRAGVEGFDWDSIALADLPESLQSMSADELDGYVNAKRAERESVQTEIQAVSLKREAFIRDVRSREIASSDIGEAMRQAIREQAMALGFTCDGC
jgi:hypothetical protein